METYLLLRELAGGAGLVFLFAIFVGVVLFTFRKGSGAIHQDIAGIPFRHEDSPADDRKPEDRR